MKFPHIEPHPSSPNSLCFTTILDFEVAQCVGPRGYWATIELPIDYWHSNGAYRFNFGEADGKETHNN